MYSNKPNEILNAWLAFEVLSPQTFRKYKDLVTSPFGTYIPLKNEGALPWEDVDKYQKDKYRLYFHLVINTIDFEKAIHALVNVYADKVPERPQAKGKAIISSILLNENGVPLQQSIASFAYGFVHALSKSLTALSKWADVEAEWQKAITKILSKYDEEGSPLPISRQTIEELSQYLIKEIGIDATYLLEEAFVITTYEYGKGDNMPAPLLLNSFYINDLMKAQQLVNERNVPTLLTKYLSAAHNNPIDLLKNIPVLDELIAPKNIPLGRWPGPNRHPLVLLQQAAVNAALREIKDGDILAVNGPPGTGKTTLLRDVVAGIIIKRADKMLTYDDPMKAFKATDQRLNVGAAFLKFFELDDALCGFEMVIASSNNKAVENISSELPSMEAIANDANELRLFPCLATKVLEKEGWGLIAAVLGNGSNKSRFKQHFWWDKDVGMSTYLSEVQGYPQIVDKYTENGEVYQEIPTIIQEIDHPKNSSDALQNWLIARENFENAKAKCALSLKELDAARKKLQTLKELLSEESNIRQAILAIESDQENCEAHLHSAASQSSLYEEEVLQLQKEKLQLQAGKPGFWARLFKTKKYRLWLQQLALLELDIKLIQQKIKKNDHLIRDAEKQIKKIAAHLHKLLLERHALERKIASCRQKIEKVRTKVDGHFIDDDFYKLSQQEQQTTSPWCNKETQLLRDEVFIAAIKLHKAFIDAAANPLKHNLGICMQILSNTEFDSKEQKELVKSVWSSFFLVVPCISTTFASVERMFYNLPLNSLGYLLIDEAGQALPQAAVGALLRTKKAIIVGDPAQIEPVVTLPSTLTTAIAKKLSVDPSIYNAPVASVQTIADNISAYSTNIEGRTGTRKVGLPLLVHRRCDNPMFSIANAIAYDRLMIHAKPTPKANLIQKVLGDSRWLDVQSISETKWSPEEGYVVIDLLQKLRSNNVKPNLYIVSPFTMVVDHLRKLILDSNVLAGWENDPHTWVYEQVGTVHTVQGREAVAVIFVLGASGDDMNGTRNWAGGKPNIANVALTRAKSLCYVIGNEAAWRSAGVFSDISRLLKKEIV
ncbi:superfamily I DNA and/or RNA helicase [Chitinophaga skermanii]|uniref:Superfamily I DNA and/or RNA helicase n=1 Tax=Chitinophaga skermanii TaxID=331697 RepID=A0A327QG99_9BACT|nr:AAA domain-containing protein [Chitinophaga skermanii]RAJ02343.1 superfamily I DNA and/or RNA helicase [Chitinophaga skermanii]